VSAVRPEAVRRAGAIRHSILGLPGPSGQVAHPQTRAGQRRDKAAAPAEQRAQHAGDAPGAQQPTGPPISVGLAEQARSGLDPGSRSRPTRRSEASARTRVSPEPLFTRAGVRPYRGVGVCAAAAGRRSIARAGVRAAWLAGRLPSPATWRPARNRQRGRRRLPCGRLRLALRLRLRSDRDAIDTPARRDQTAHEPIGQGGDLAVARR